MNWQEQQEEQIAFELLTASSEGELDEALGRAVGAGARSAGGALSPLVLRDLSSLIKRIAGRGLGVDIGGGASSQAANQEWSTAAESQVESSEGNDLERARGVARFGGLAGRMAGRLSRTMPGANVAGPAARMAMKMFRGAQARKRRRLRRRRLTPGMKWPPRPPQWPWPRPPHRPRRRPWPWPGSWPWRRRLAYVWPDSVPVEDEPQIPDDAAPVDEPPIGATDADEPANGTTHRCTNCGAPTSNGQNANGAGPDATTDVPPAMGDDSSNDNVEERTMHDVNAMNPFQTELDALESGDFEFGYEGQGGLFGEGEGEGESPLDEAAVMELAADLLSVTNEGELDQFFGKLFKKIKGVAGKIGKNPIFRAVGGALKGVAKQALPGIGAALGSFIPIPGVGTALGGALGTAASNLFEGDFEGMSPEDRDFEIAQRFVRLASGALKRVANLPDGLDPRAAAKAALAAAAKRYAPGLLSFLGETGPMGPSTGSWLPSPTSPASPYGWPSRPGVTGRWIRRGRKIVLLGV